MINSYREDFVVIWGHGLLHTESIIDILRSEESFEINLVIKKEVGNIAKLVNKIYSFDYAPIMHLKTKIQYLKNTPPQVLFIFLRNNDPDEHLIGEGPFRHVECLKIKKIKTLIREKYNPRCDDGLLSDDHVIHASDNETQTDKILKFLGYSKGVKTFINNSKIISSPFYIKEPSKFTLKEVDIEKIFCRNFSQYNGKNELITIPISESIQYIALENIRVYKEYLKKHRGISLKADYSIKKYQQLYKNFNNTKAMKEGVFVHLYYDKQHKRYIILDGLHRASIHLKKGDKKIISCVYE